ncbi:hypothetical protein CC1G_15122 [Coprinopsis cinerea okayama7|uniref:Uncharacterized protein n=1 Tax=Coprinopsis cinerea (strain Okayama-7 / 130 / ATCC MYA-4618 / FGSC 9003) TaxID=240176 RepID=D6RPL3_COPC7|nr:hypothetical protein CC1G_15122 [Coprinopsis cinerea okayama7\|eukprot:XP_002910482.1 hypothetical protein CC1G_15122 [Coprinopsis cinerea okayama7\
MRVDQDLPREFGDRYFQQPMDEHCIGRRWSLFKHPSHLADVPLLVESLSPELLDSKFLDKFSSLKYQIRGEYIIVHSLLRRDRGISCHVECPQTINCHPTSTRTQSRETWAPRPAKATGG